MAVQSNIVIDASCLYSIMNPPTSELPNLLPSDQEEVHEELVFYETTEKVNAELSTKPPKQDNVKMEIVPNKSMSDDPGDTDDDDEETIATFLTSSGQRLALYAVEDSDEIFAVAAYDESGTPPTDFQFLMKADVERLIGEGAVKTMKRRSGKSQQNDSVSTKAEEAVKQNKSTTPVKAEQNKTTTPPKTQQTITTVSSTTQQNKTTAVLSQPAKAVTTVTCQESKAPISTTTQVENKKPSPVKQVTPSLNKQSSPISNKQTTTNLNKQPIAPKVQSPAVAKKVVPSPSKLTVKQDTLMASPKKVIAQKKSPDTLQKNTAVDANPQFTYYMSCANESIGIDPEDEKALESEEELVEQSTVQYILCDNDPCDSDLTFAEIEASLNAFKKQPADKKTTMPVVIPRKIETKPEPKKKENIIIKTPVTKYCPIRPKSKIVVQNHRVQTTPKIIQTHAINSNQLITHKLPQNTRFIVNNFKSSPRVIQSSPKPNTHVPMIRTYSNLKKIPAAEIQSNLEGSIAKTASKPNIVINQSTTGRQSNIFKSRPSVLIKQEKVDDYEADDYFSDDLPPPSNVENSLIESSPLANQSKGKRSRKQQLTTMNRGDSEIVIQPLSVYPDEEEEEEPVIVKKRGRRRKKSLPDPDYSPRVPQKRSRRSSRLIEVIDLDNEEIEGKDRKRSKKVLEITLDGNKEKGSSDKENDVHSITDDSEDDEEIPIKKKIRKKATLQCAHCLRKFRLRKTLEMHVRSCSQLPDDLRDQPRKRGRKKKVTVTEENVPVTPASERKFKCKLCEQVYDQPLALARHVRLIHTPKGKKRWSRLEYSDRSMTPEVSDKGAGKSEDDSKKESPTKKRRGRPSRVRKESERSVSTEVSDKESSKNKEDNKLDEVPKRRGRPAKRKESTRSATPSVSEENVDENEDDSKADRVPRKRGRPSKIKEKERSVSPPRVENSEQKKSDIEKSKVQLVVVINKEEQSVIHKKDNKNEKKVETDENIEDKIEEKGGKKLKKEKNSEESLVKTGEEESKGKSGQEKEDEVEASTENNTDEKVNKTWKVKKLNCSTCGKYFSSADELNTHCLEEHKSKATGVKNTTCPECKKVVPASEYLAHSKSHKKTKDSLTASKSAPAVSKESQNTKQKNQVNNKTNNALEKRRSTRLRTSL